MDAFSNVFSLFAILLGFALLEVMSGLIRTLKARHKVRLGWLTPLLSVLVMLQITSFWIKVWETREHLTVNAATLNVGILFAMIYLFSASMIFPERPDEWADLDDYYFEHKRPVLAGVLFCKLALTLLLGLVQGRWTSHGWVGTWIGLPLGLIILTVLSVFAVLAKGKRLNLALLILLILPMIGWSL